MASFIQNADARWLLDSNGLPAIEAEITVSNKTYSAIVPGSIGRSSNETKETRDLGNSFQGKGLKKAISNIRNIIAPKIEGIDVEEQADLDNFLIELDGTEDKSRLGSNTLLGISIAACRAGAISRNMELYKYIGMLASMPPKIPIPIITLINGGKSAANPLAVQSFSAVSESSSFSEAIKNSTELYHALGKNLRYTFGNMNTAIGLEGGFAFNTSSLTETANLIEQSIRNLEMEDKMRIAVNAAAHHFYSDGNYKIDEEMLDTNQLLSHYLNLNRKFDLFSIMDPFEEHEWPAYAELTEKIGDTTLIASGNLIASNPISVKKAIKLKACNSLLLKPSQIGTVTETLQAAKHAKNAEWKTIVSTRTGETNDTFPADLAVGLGCKLFSGGAPCRAEHTSQYNRIMKIEEQLSPSPNSFFRSK